MATNKLRVGIIGIGWYALQAHVPIFRQDKRVELSAICRRNPERLAMAQKATGVERAYTDWREMLDRENLDAVLVCTPHDLHTEPTLAALERGLHVLLEKPMALDSHEARLITEAAERANRVLLVGYNSRGDGGWRTVKKLLDGGTLGHLRQMNITCAVDARAIVAGGEIPADFRDWLNSDDPVGIMMRDVMSEGNWRSGPAQMGGGMFLDIGSHKMDELIWLTGSSVSEVVASMDSIGPSTDAMVNCQGRMKNGIWFSINFNSAVSTGARALSGNARLTVFGDKGVLTADWDGVSNNTQEIWTDVEGVRQKVEPSEPTISMTEAFLAAVLDGAPNLGPGRECMETVAFGQAVYRSAAEHRIVTVD